MRFRILPEAERDIDKAVDYYIEHRPRFTTGLYQAVENAIQRIIATPGSFPLTEEDTPGEEARYFMLKKYRYCIIYTVHESEIVVVALIHHHQDSSHWINRLTEES